MEMDKKDECLLVEGYTDVISLHQAGIENVVASGGTSLTQDQLKLIKKYTNNLTIIYDGDAAGIKAALRGLDMALEEGLNVQLLLIPDNEDPDSYVQKIGKNAFYEFVQKNKKDFILFQLQVALGEAGNDTHKKAALVNQVAESISRVNKAEDFTKQQEYIRQCATLLNVDETGMTNLVNKFIRERISRTENKFSIEEAKKIEESALQQKNDDLNESLNLFLKNELQERAIVKSLLLYGHHMLDESKKVADYIFDTLNHFHLDNKSLERIVEIYHEWYDTGIQPNEKTFLYHDDKEIAATIVSLLEFPYELSANWLKIHEGININNDRNALQDAIDSINYYKLRKIKQMLDENQKELEKTKDADEHIKYINIHKELKDIEREITKQLGTVIIR